MTVINKTIIFSIIPIFKLVLKHKLHFPLVVSASKTCKLYVTECIQIWNAGQLSLKGLAGKALSTIGLFIFTLKM